MQYDLLIPSGLVIAFLIQYIAIIRIWALLHKIIESFMWKSWTETGLWIYKQTRNYIKSLCWLENRFCAISPWTEKLNASINQQCSGLVPLFHWNHWVTKKVFLISVVRTKLDTLGCNSLLLFSSYYNFKRSLIFLY